MSWDASPQNEFASFHVQRHFIYNAIFFIYNAISLTTIARTFRLAVVFVVFPRSLRARSDPPCSHIEDAPTGGKGNVRYRFSDLTLSRTLEISRPLAGVARFVFVGFGTWALPVLFLSRIIAF